MAVLPLLPPSLFPAETTRPLVEPLAAPEDEFPDEPTHARVDIPLLVAELHQLVSRSESYAHAAEALLSEVTLNSPAGPSRRARRIVDHLTSSREAATRALELIEALAAEMAKAR